MEVKRILKFTIPNGVSTTKHNPVVDLDTLREIITVSPKTVVDVGAGDGFWSKVVKEFFGKCFVTAVEINPDYIKNYNLKKFYDTVINADIHDVIDQMDSGDLIIFGDVLEHLEKKKAMEVMESANKKFRFIIVNAPLGFQEQQHECEYELHRCGLDYFDFQKYSVLEFNQYGNMFNCFIKGEGDNG